MHIRLSRTFLGLSEIDLRAHDALIDRLMHVHLQRNHLLCLTPAEVLKLRRSIQFGPQALRVLETVLRRSQDYAASLRASSLHLVVMPLGLVTAPSPLGIEFYVRAEDMGWWLENAPALYVENGISDGSVYNFIISRSSKIFGGSPSNINVRPYHGGGSPLGAVMRDLVGDGIQGICICDRDKASGVPPFVDKSTSFHAHDALHQMRIVDQLGQSLARNPFFSFYITHGWGVENYLGPHVLNLFFDAHPEARAQRSAFISLFPNFPKLEKGEIEEWWTLNFKSSTQPPDAIEEGLRTRFAWSAVRADRCAALAKLSIPSNAISFVSTQAKAGRYHRELMTAFDCDMRADIYKDAVEDLSRRAYVALAADSRMNFA